jgi:trans-aconitate 2-methyltransferase
MWIRSAFRLTDAEDTKVRKRVTDTWDPLQYEKFEREREQPFFDLLALVRPKPSMRVVDLGCGTGKQTRLLHERLHARETIGIDSSPKMLGAQPAVALPQGLRFEVGAIEQFPGGAETFDLVFSNAALHWFDHHEALLPRLAQALAPRGQLAFQVPAMHDEATHHAADEVAASEPFKSALAGWRRVSPVLPPERYAKILYAAGFRAPHVRLMIYPHVLPGPEAVVDWTKGTLLTEYARRLPADLFDPFVERYRSRLLAQLEPARPCLFPFKRILCWGERSA